MTLSPSPARIIPRTFRRSCGSSWRTVQERGGDCPRDCSSTRWNCGMRRPLLPRVSRHCEESERCRRKTIWKVHRIKAASMADRLVCQSHRRGLQTRSATRMRQSSVRPTIADARRSRVMSRRQDKSKRKAAYWAAFAGAIEVSVFVIGRCAVIRPRR